MMKFYIVGLWVLVFSACAGFEHAEDSSLIIPQKKKGSFTIISRVHTMGLFLYMGKAVNNNPAADVYFNYTTAKGWGFSTFKVTDINDVHSPNNFMLMVFSKSFHLGNRFTVTPYMGAALEQQHAFADEGSDAFALLTSTFKFSTNFSAEHTAMFNNLIFEPTHSDWTNRFRLMYSKGHVDITGLFWNNTALIDNQSYITTGLSIFYNRIPLSKRASCGAGVTGLMVARVSDPEQGPVKNGIQFTTALTIK